MKMDTPQQKAITFEVGMQDSALASTLAISFFEPVCHRSRDVFLSAQHFWFILASLENHTEKAPD